MGPSERQLLTLLLPPLARQSLGRSLSELQDHFKISGPSALISSSCSASLQALAVAKLWIQQGKVKRCIVGSTEILSDLTIQGFQCLRLLSKDVAKPFSANRNGINLGEASAFFCIEAAETSSATATAWLTGVGFSTDAYHPTAPHPEGKGSAASIRQALQDAHLTSQQIDWIHAHGTGSIANDLAEFFALKSCFGDNIPPVTSTKPIHGHTLGASGALETALIVQAFDQNKILPTLNQNNPDPKIQVTVFTDPVAKDLKHILKNSLGFGGINVSVVLSKDRTTS